MSFHGVRSALAFSVAGALCAQTVSADACHLTWDMPCCPLPCSNVGSATTVLTICNCTDIPSEYRFDMKSPTPGASFSPQNGVVSLQPGQCIDINITVFCTPSPTGEAFVLYEANVVNLNTGNAFSCTGHTRDGVIVKAIPGPGNVTGPVGTPIDVAIVVSTNNPLGTPPVEVPLTVVTMGAVVVLEAPQTLLAVPGEARVHHIRVMPVNDPPTAPMGDPMFADVLLEWDDDGDGVLEVNSSFGVRVLPEPCAGDLNGDGRVDGADLAQLLGGWGPCF